MSSAEPPDWSSVFAQLAPVYSSAARYSPECMRQIIDMMLRQMPANAALLDAACGTAVPSAMLATLNPKAKVTLADISMPMLLKARSGWPKGNERSAFVQCDLEQVPFRRASFDAVLISCALHLFGNRSAALQGVAHVLRPRGSFFVVTYNPEDLRSQIFNAYFPGFMDFDSQVHPDLASLTAEISAQGFCLQSVSSFPYEFEFDDANAAVAFAATKPFSTFWRYSNEAFEIALKKFESGLKADFGTRRVVNRCWQTLLAFYRS